MLTGLRRDFQYAVRTLFREPGFAAVVVITLALGIGGTTATYSGLEDEFSRSLIEGRTMVKFVGSLSGIALLLAAVGLYGVMTHATRQRTTEIGVRLALGATPASILNMIVLRGVRLVAIGAAFGLTGALVAVRFVRVRLFGVEPTDPVTWIAVSAVPILVALVGCGLPARRAMRIDPATALRSS